jgi:hypothetical protein
MDLLEQINAAMDETPPGISKRASTMAENCLLSK